MIYDDFVNAIRNNRFFSLSIMESLLVFIQYCFGNIWRNFPHARKLITHFLQKFYWSHSLLYRQAQLNLNLLVDFEIELRRHPVRFRTRREFVVGKKR